MIRVDPEGVLQRASLAGLGLGLVGYGLMRKGLVGAIACAAGSAIAYSGWTGRSLLPTCSNKTPNAKPAAPGEPSGGTGSSAAPRDSVDEASMQSFPASDPPGSVRTDAVG